MRPLVGAAEMRAAEQEAATRGLSSAALMQLAGRGAAQALLVAPRARAARYLVLAGPGNNGGDALVVAGLLAAAGAPVRIVTYHRGQLAAGDPAGIERFESGEDADGERLRKALLQSDVLVDGILGTGRSRPPEPDLQALLRTIHHAPVRHRVVALDLPTGVDADTGAADSLTVHADETLTFGYVKRGLLLYPARDHCGAIRLIDIGLPLPPAVPVATTMPEAADMAGRLPERAPTAQKYSAGAVLALSGAPHYVGAPLLCSGAALRSGAGYVTLAASGAASAALAGRLLEQTLLPLPTEGDALAVEEALGRLREAASRYHTLLIGPGLGRDDHTMDLVRRVLRDGLKGPRNAVVDADALFALAQTPDWHEHLALPIVLTPHTGEMARLTGLEAREIEANRLDIAATWAARWRQVLVLKGAPTIVAAPDGALSLNPTGNALLATAGTGDVLSGVIAAFLAGGAAPFDAARAGVYVHGLAADLARPRFGDRGMLAGDLLPLLPLAIHELQRAARPITLPWTESDPRERHGKGTP